MTNEEIALSIEHRIENKIRAGEVVFHASHDAPLPGYTSQQNGGSAARQWQKKVAQSEQEAQSHSHEQSASVWEKEL